MDKKRGAFHALNLDLPLYVFRSVSAVSEIRVTLFLPKFQSAQIALQRS